MQIDVAVVWFEMLSRYLPTDDEANPECQNNFIQWDKVTVA